MKNAIVITHCRLR